MTPLSQLNEREQDEAFEQARSRLVNHPAIELACLVYLNSDGVSKSKFMLDFELSVDDLKAWLKKCKKCGLVITQDGDNLKLESMRKVNRFERNKENTPKPKLNKTIEKVFR